MTKKLTSPPRHVPCSRSNRHVLPRVGLVVALALLGSHADALPRLGSQAPSARVVDADDAVIDLAALKNKPILVVYEDKESATLNAALKADLSRLAKGDRYRNAVALVPVADVQGYDYWPVRGFVKDAIRGESKKIGATIYCDWDGTFRQRTGIARNTSTVVLFDRNGRVLFAHEGLVPPERRAELLGLLRSEVEQPSS